MRSKEAVDISMTSAFGEYVNVLWDDYGLIFVDAGYKSRINSMILAEERYRDCMNANFDERSPVPMLGKDLLKLKCTAAETMNVRFATDDKGLAIRHQAADYMHYHCNEAYVLELYNALADVNDYEFNATGLDTHVTSAMSELRWTSGSYEVSRWTDWQYGAVISDKPVSPFTVLSLVMPIGTVSTKEITLDSCVSHRKLNKGNYTAGAELNAVDKILFKEYLIEKNADYVHQREETALSYEAEYLICGHGSDAKNLAGIVHRILLLREVANFERIYNDPGKMSIIRTITNVIAWVLMEPEIAEPLATMIAACWAYIESIKDVKVLMAGGRVPFLKSDGEFYTDVYGSSAGHAEDKGLSYEDYLRAFIMLTDNEKLAVRFLDLLETSVINKDHNPNFRLDFCFDAWAVRAYITSGYGYDYVAERNRDLWE
ncbi:MAG: DUF5702 domain-containing protein [Lachnospiraceae bacterium]|nr:DUF5702 domain-containing protein [Lachnospiraceae bacterium]